MKLTIITLALTERRAARANLEAEIQRQVNKHAPGEVEHLIFEDEGGTPYGLKMGRAFRQAQGEYVCVLDDDDWISPNYLFEICGAMETNPDVITFRALREDKREFWQFGLEIIDGRREDGPVRMMANHLCAWRRDLAQASVWLPLRYAPDVFWYRLLHAAAPAAGYLEARINEVLYFYRYDSNKTRCQRPLDCSITVERCSGGVFGWRVIETGALVLSAFGVFLQPEDREIVQDASGRVFTIPREALQPLCYTDLQ